MNDDWHRLTCQCLWHHPAWLMPETLTCHSSCGLSPNKDLKNSLIRGSQCLWHYIWFILCYTDMNDDWHRLIRAWEPPWTALFGQSQHSLHYIWFVYNARNSDYTGIRPFFRSLFGLRPHECWYVSVSGISQAYGQLRQLRQVRQVRSDSRSGQEREHMSHQTIYHRFERLKKSKIGEKIGDRFGDRISLNSVKSEQFRCHTADYQTL